MNKASGGDGIPVKLFQILKDDTEKVLHSICQQIWKTHQQPQDWKRSVFIPIPKKGNAKECSNYHTIAIIYHTNKVILKILQVRLQQYMNRELPILEKAEKPEIKLSTSVGLSKKQESFQKNIYFCFIDYTKAFVLLLLLLIHFSCVRLCATPQMAAQQAPLSLGFSRQEHWSGLLLPSSMHESEKCK